MKYPYSILDEKTIKTNPKLIAYGSFNVYEIDRKVYYRDFMRKKYVRAPERDFMISKTTIVK